MRPAPDSERRLRAAPKATPEPTLVDVRELVEVLIEQSLFRPCQVCAAVPLPPHDADAERAILAHAVALQHLDTLAGLRPSHIFDPWREVLARFVLPPAVAPHVDELLEMLEDEHPGTAGLWKRMLSELYRVAPATHLPHVLRAQVERVIRLSDDRDLSRAMDRLDAENRGGGLTRAEVFERLRTMAQAFRSNP